MNGSLTIVDNVLDNSLELRKEVLKEGFRDLTYQDTPYHTVNVTVDPTSLVESIKAIMGCDIKVEVTAFRLGAEKSPLHNLVHSDNSCSTMAAVYYLNLPEQCIGGTAFWRHRKTGWNMQPSEILLRDFGITLEEWGNDWHKEDAWEMETLAGMRHNRIIIYPSDAMHSRWPWGGFGDTPETARLVWVAMFDCIEY